MTSDQKLKASRNGGAPAGDDMLRDIAAVNSQTLKRTLTIIRENPHLKRTLT